MQSGVIHYALKKQLQKMTVAIHMGTYSLLITEHSSLHFMDSQQHHFINEVATMELQELLQKYSRLFDEPSNLPPRRHHDHHIPLKNKSQVVKIKPYRYPMV